MELLNRNELAKRLAGHETALDIHSLPITVADDDSLRSWKFPVPPRAGGSCSRKLALEPFDALGAARAAVPGSSEQDTLRRLRSLRAICAAVAERTSAQWCGVYQVVEPGGGGGLSEFGGDDGAANLLKLAYVGAPSRPYFPLTAAFSEGSNNSTVAMSGRAVVYHDVLSLPGDAPYYVCDGQVRAEACVPIFGGRGEVVGIMDVEAFQPDVFRGEGLGVVLAACAELGAANLLRAISQPVGPKASIAEEWQAMACRLPAKLPKEERDSLRAAISLTDRSGYFELSRCPINAEAEQRMEQISSLVSGEEYARSFNPGLYSCARCGHALYAHTSKFTGPCLWPSFRAPLEVSSLHTIAVAQGAYNHYSCSVVELYCAGCSLFLGHAFEDGATTGDTHPDARWRHCVLSLSLQFAWDVV